MSTTAIGQKVEELVARQLRKAGHQVIAHNARTRFYEIDIIAKKHHTLHFVEVKYRKNAIFGDGLEAITYQKKQRLIKAANAWLADNPEYQNCEVSIDAVSVVKNGGKLEAHFVGNITE